MRDQVQGRFMCDAFVQVPPADDAEYCAFVRRIVMDYNIDVVLPQTSYEQAPWTYLKDTLRVPVIVANRRAVEICSDKLLTYATAREWGIPVPDFFQPQVGGAICYKPRKGKGSRGFGKLELGDDMIVMDYVDGMETAVDALCYDGKILKHFCRHRTDARGGLAYTHSICHCEEELTMAAKLVEKLNYSWLINVQFKGGVLMEINPRLSTQIWWKGFNIVAWAIRLALGEITEQDILDVPEIPQGIRSFYYHNQMTFIE
jgi:hypothetical protein